jgi:hypothetical protein
MLTLQEAQDLAHQFLNNPQLVLIQTPVHEGDYGWIFSYQSKKFMETKDGLYALMGNQPLLVDKHTSTVVHVSTRHSFDQSVANYLAGGDPHTSHS